MKLARAVINEVINLANVDLFQLKVASQEMDYYYVLNTKRKPSNTTIIIPVKDKKFRPILVTSTYGLQKLKTSPFGPKGKVDYFVSGDFQKELHQGILNNSREKGLPEAETLAMIKSDLSVKVKKDHGWMEPDKFKAWLIKEGVNLSHFVVFPELEGIDLEDHFFKHGKVELFGFQEKAHKYLIDILDKAEKELSKHGFGSVYYGKIYLVPTDKQKSKALADYSGTTDVMRIFNRSHKSLLTDDPLQTLIHEFAHRYWYKMLTDSGRIEAGSVFAEKLTLLKNEKPIYKKKKNDYKIGDRVPTKFGDLEYIGFNEVDGKMKHQFAPVFQGKAFVDGTKLNFDDMAKASEYFNISTAVSSKDTESLNYTDEQWMPSEYAKKDMVEWFAEIFSWAVIKNNKEVLKWIKGLK